MRYQVTMTIDIEEVSEKVLKKKPVAPTLPEESKPSLEPPIDHLVYGIEDAAIALGISRTSIYNLIKEGTLPVVKLGKRTLIPVLELKALIKRIQIH